MMNEERMDAVFGEDEPILPDGWQEGDDIFADAGNDIKASAEEIILQEVIYQ